MSNADIPDDLTQVPADLGPDPDLESDLDSDLEPVEPETPAHDEFDPETVAHRDDPDEEVAASEGA